MKTKILLLVCLLTFSGFSLSAQIQSFCSVQLLNSDCDTMKMEVCMFFPFGSNPACPFVVGNNTTVNGNTLEMELFYDISGIWVAMWCTRTDTIINSIPSGVTNIHLKASAISYLDTIHNNADTTLALCTVGVEEFHHGVISVNPNPAGNKIIVNSKMNFNSILIRDIIGNILLTTKTNEIDLEKIPAGVYILNAIAEDRVYTTKFVKE